MFDKLRRSTQLHLTPTAESTQREEIPYWATLKSIYLASLAKRDTEKAQRRLRRQEKHVNGTIDSKPQPIPRPRRYPVEIIGKLPPDGIPRPPSFIYTAPVKRFQAPQPRMPSYADDPHSAHPTQFFPEHASARHSRNSLFSNSDDPFSVRPSQFLENAAIRYSPRNSRQPRTRCSWSPIVHEQPIPEDPSSARPLPINLHPSRETVCSVDSASVYSQESLPRYPASAKSRRDCTFHFPDNPSSPVLMRTRSSFTLALVPEHVRHPRNHNHPPSDVPTTPKASRYSREAMLVDRCFSHAIPTRTTSAHSDETLIDRSSHYSGASLCSRASIIPIHPSSRSRLNRSSTSTIQTTRQGTNGEDDCVSRNYGEEIPQIDDSDSDSTDDDSDLDSISSISSVSSEETAFYSCDDETEGKNNAERNVIHKARMDVLAVAETLRDTQDDRSSTEIKFREDVVTGLAHVFTEVAAHGKAKQRHLAPLKCRSNYSLMSLDDKNVMPGAFVPTPGGRGRSASTAKLLFDA